MMLSITTRPDRQVRALDAPEGALMMTGNGNLAIPVGAFSAQLVGDTSTRFLHDFSARGLWTILSSDTHELELPVESVTLTERTFSIDDLAGVDANGRGVEWRETNLPNHENNTWEWFTFKSDEPLAAEDVAYPIQAWVI